jgi:non-ribosomal peptide synthetase component F
MESIGAFDEMAAIACRTVFSASGVTPLPTRVVVAAAVVAGLADATAAVSAAAAPREQPATQAANSNCFNIRNLVCSVLTRRRCVYVPFSHTQMNVPELTAAVSEI